MKAAPLATGRYACTVCSYAYDPAHGDPAGKIPAGTPFAALPPKWRCPWCGAPKGYFVSEDGLDAGSHLEPRALESPDGTSSGAAK